jgi:hypothetical protein
MYEPWISSQLARAQQALSDLPLITAEAGCLSFEALHFLGVPQTATRLRG